MSKLLLLSQNGKMKKSSKVGRFELYNFGIPAFRSQDNTVTCPNAGICAKDCYAQNGTYNFPNVVNAYERRLDQTRELTRFEALIRAEIGLVGVQANAKDKECLIRIHDSGDFYSEQYLDKWIEIIQNLPLIHFYAYTKNVQWTKARQLPNNFTAIYSFGGKQDNLIDCQKDRHSMVFPTLDHLLDAGYVDASQDDTVAAFSKSNKIGLVYHGRKKYAKTLWARIVPE